MVPVHSTSADDVFSVPDLCAIILRPKRTEISDLKAVATIAAAASVSSMWRSSVASSEVWRAACLARWPSTSQLPLAPSVDFRRLYQSRAVAQMLVAPRLRPDEVYFLLEMRGRDGLPLVSQCLSLGSCSVQPAAARCKFIWHVPGLALPRSWSFEGCGLWRRTDGLVHAFGEWSMPRRRMGLYEASSSSEEEGDMDGLYAADGGGGEEDEEEEGGSDDDMDSFINDSGLSDVASMDDSSVVVSEESEEAGSVGSGGAQEGEESEEGEGEEEGEEEDEDEGEDEDEDEDEEAEVGEDLTSPEGSETEAEGGVVRASCHLEVRPPTRSRALCLCFSRGRLPVLCG